MAEIRDQGSVSATPYPEINELLSDLVGRVQEILGGRLIGIYLFGSLAIGDFHVARSDIDFVAVTDDLLPDMLVAALEAMHNALAATPSPWASRLEGVYVPMWMLRHQLRSRETRVIGPPLHDVIDEVTGQDLQWAVRDILNRWWAPMVSEATNMGD